MNKYVLVNGKPYLFADGRAYGARKNKEGFTVGKAVELPEIPTRTYSELSINAKFPDGFDSIEEDTENTPDEAEAFTAVSESAIEGALGLTADADDIVIVRDGKDLVIPNEANTYAPDEMTVAELREYATDNEVALNGARTKGAIVEAIENAQETTEDTAEVTLDPIDELGNMSLEELKEYAKEHEIKLNGARTKGAIVEAITKAHNDETAEK